MRFHLNQWFSQRMVCESSNNVILIIPFTTFTILYIAIRLTVILRCNYKNNECKLLILFA